VARAVGLDGAWSEGDSEEDAIAKLKEVIVAWALVNIRLGEGASRMPREVIRLMVNLLFIEDDEMLTGLGVVRTLFDPACGRPPVR